MTGPFPIDDYRADGGFPTVRTVCHGCRRMAQTHTPDSIRLRTLIVPGDGVLINEVSPGQLTSAPCPLCGDSEDTGWLPGFIPPV